MQSKEFRPTPDQIPGQQLEYPASQKDMNPKPDSDLSNYSPANKLQGKVALITGGDSGIGRAVAIAFAMEGADVAILYNVNDEDAEQTQAMVEAKGQQCLTIKGDVRDPLDCQTAVEQTVVNFGRLNILVNNAAYQMTQARLRGYYRRAVSSDDGNQYLWLFLHGEGSCAVSARRRCDHQHRQYCRQDWQRVSD